MTTTDYLKKLKSTPDIIEFSEIMDVIESEYDFHPTAFKNGDIENSESENLGSCKIFSFGQMHGLSEEQTLACFGAYYREDVLQNPNANDHQNIRNFIQSGWNAIKFSGNALTTKTG